MLTSLADITMEICTDTDQHSQKRDISRNKKIHEAIKKIENGTKFKNWCTYIFQFSCLLLYLLISTYVSCVLLLPINVCLFISVVSRALQRWMLLCVSWCTASLGNSHGPPCCLGLRTAAGDTWWPMINKQLYISSFIKCTPSLSSLLNCQPHLNYQLQYSDPLQYSSLLQYPDLLQYSDLL